MCQQVKQGKPSVTSGEKKTETPHPDCGAPQLKQKGDKTRTQKKGGDNSSGGRNPKKKEKREEAMQGDTIKKKKGGDNSRADYSPQKWGRYVFYSGETTPPGLSYVRP